LAKATSTEMDKAFTAATWRGERFFKSIAECRFSYLQASE
jgi:hypothetical protein